MPVVALMAALSLAACGGHAATSLPATPTATLSPSQAVAAAARASQSMKSFDLGLTSKMTMAASQNGKEQTLDVATDATGTEVVKPLAAKLDMTVKATGTGSDATTQKIQTYMEQSGKNIDLYVGQGSNWQKQSVALANNQYNYAGAMKLYLKNAKSFTDQGAEAVGGSPARKISATISGSSLKQAIRASGSMSSLAQMMGATEEQFFAALPNDLGSMPVTFWIDSASNRLVRYHMDEAKVLQTIFASLGSSTSGVKVKAMSTDVTLSHIDEAKTVQIPASVKKTAEG